MATTTPNECEFLKLGWNGETYCHDGGCPERRFKPTRQAKQKGITDCCLECSHRAACVGKKLACAKLC